MTKRVVAAPDKPEVKLPDKASMLAVFERPADAIRGHGRAGDDGLGGQMNDGVESIQETAIHVAQIGADVGDKPSITVFYFPSRTWSDGTPFVAKPHKKHQANR